MITPIILCGGSGTRLWPRSRAMKPKPFLPLVRDKTLFEATLARSANPAIFTAPVVVTGKGHLEHVTAQSADVAGLQIIIEPEARNTAPAIALAAARLPEDAIMLVCPSDHYIKDQDAFIRAAQSAARLAKDDWMVAFGIEAKRPETGFGYILRGTEITSGCHRIERFVEKPDRAKAEQFLNDGGYSWNGGIFAFRAGAFLAELEQYRPEMAKCAKQAVSAGTQDGAHFHPEAATFAKIEPDSVDYAVMENTQRAAVVAADMGWSDIGNWEALREARSGNRDADGNWVSGKGELIDCSNVMIDSDGPRVSVIGLDDVVVVVDGDEVLIVSSAGAQQVGKLSGAKFQ